MIRLFVVAFAALLAGCSTLNGYGIGSPPRLVCMYGEASIDDRLLGSDAVHLSLVRRMEDADAICPK